MVVQVPKCQSQNVYGYQKPNTEKEKVNVKNKFKKLVLFENIFKKK